MLLAPGISKGDKYLWPIEASEDLTSGFCQWRSGHFHSGIDIGTFGKTGYKVRAVSGGSVERIVTRWRGYGKALYLRLDDGRVAVYAHLLKFTPDIDSHVQQQQLATRRYTVDLYPPEGQFRFEAGDVVAFSGQSGTGAPHLHFEIRTADHRPLSPLAFYPRPKDDRPPTIRSISVRPLSPTLSRIDGRSKLTAVKLRGSNGRYFARDTLTIYGPVGIELECVDRRPKSDRVFAVSAIQMYIDSVGTPFFSTTYDTIDFERWGEVHLELNYSMALEGKRFVHNLYLLPGVAAPLVNDIARNRGVVELCDSIAGIDLSPGVHKLIFRVSDQSGNACWGEMFVDLRPHPPFPGETGASSHAHSDRFGRIQYSIARFDRSAAIFIDLLSGPDAAAFLDYLDGNIGLAGQYKDLAGASMLITAKAADGARFDRLLRLSDTGMPLFSPFASVPPGCLAVSPVRSRYHPIRLDVERLLNAWDDRAAMAGSVCLSLPVRFDEIDSSLSIDPEPVAVHDIMNVDYGRPFAAGGTGMNRMAATFADGHLVLGGKGLPSRSAVAIDTATARAGKCGPVKVFNISPKDLVVNDRMDLALRIPSGLDSSRTAVYSVTESGGASYLGGSVMGDSMICLGITKMGSYAVLQDTIPPVISKVTPAHGGRVSGPRPKITFRMSDDLSGIGDDTDVHITVDGVWAIPEFDVETGWMVTYSSQNLSPGTHLLEIRVRDRAGNEKSYSSTFDYVRQ